MRKVNLEFYRSLGAGFVPAKNAIGLFVLGLRRHSSRHYDSTQILKLKIEEKITKCERMKGFGATGENSLHQSILGAPKRTFEKYHF